MESRKDVQKEAIRNIRDGKLTAQTAEEELRKTKVKFIQDPSSLPNKNLTLHSSFAGMSILDLDYDQVVYDTYDYLDKVIAISLTDPICAALEMYHQRTGDARAKALIDYVRYGTHDSTDIWLMRYGFGFEEIEWLREHIDKIDDKQITFKPSIHSLDQDRLEAIERYL